MSESTSKLDVNEVVKDQTEFMSSELPTPRYAWVALFATWLISIAIPMAWFALPGVASRLIPWMVASWVIPGQMTLDPGAAFGFLMNAIAWTAIIVAIPTGWIIRRIGPKPTLIISGIITAVGMAGVALFFNVSYETFLAFRVITGIGVGMCSVTGPTAVSLWFSNKHRFMAVAIWSTWVPVGMLFINNVSPALTSSMAGVDDLAGFLMNPANMAVATSQFQTVWWLITAIIVVALIVFIVLYRLPSIEKGEVSEISIERLDYKSAFPFLKNRQFVGLLIAWMLFEFVNFAFTTYDEAFLTAQFPEMWVGIEWMPAFLMTCGNACGILAPIGGWISDKLPWTKKWIIIFVGCFCLLLAVVFGWKVGAFYFFGFYLLFHIVGNVLLVGSVRPMVPFLVGRGGQTAVAVGLSILTVFQFGGECLETFVSYAIGAFASMDASAIGHVAVPPEAFQMTTWAVMLPIIANGTAFALLTRPSKAEREAAKSPAPAPDWQPGEIDVPVDGTEVAEAPVQADEVIVEEEVDADDAPASRS